MTASWDAGSLPLCCQWEEKKILKAKLKAVDREKIIDIQMKKRKKVLSSDRIDERNGIADQEEKNSFGIKEFKQCEI